VGGTEISIRGVGLGQDAQNDIAYIRIGSYPCSDARVPVGNEGNEIQCMVPAGIGTGHKIKVFTVRNGNSSYESSDVTFSFLPPSVQTLGASQDPIGEGSAIVYAGNTSVSFNMTVQNAGSDPNLLLATGIQAVD